MKTSQRIFWGLILIGLAVFLILNQMGLITATVGFGTILMGIICLAILVSSIANHSFGGIFFSLGLAWLNFAELCGLPKVSWVMVLSVVVLLTAGFHILFPSLTRHNSRKDHKKQKDEKWTYYENPDQVGEYQQVNDEENDGFVGLSNVFGATAKYINVQDFKGADLKNSFGEMKVYFDRAVIVKSPITVHVDNSFGEMALFIPNDWKVKHDVTVFAGEFRENNKPNGNGDGPVVNIVGSVKFGEITVTYV